MPARSYRLNAYACWWFASAGWRFFARQSP